jgi:transcriptional regulator with XRE-family HTH domain
MDQKPALEDMTFGQRLQQLRAVLKLSKKELAEQLAINVNKLHKWESGISTPYLDSVIKIVKFFKVSAEFFAKDRLSNIEISILNMLLSQNSLTGDEKKFLLEMMGFLDKLYFYKYQEDSREKETNDQPETSELPEEESAIYGG